MKSMIDNLINGNLSDAKAQAKKYTGRQIYNYLLKCGWSVNKAASASTYLIHGGQELYDAYCETCLVAK